MQAVTKGLEKVSEELTASENDGPVSEGFREVSGYSSMVFHTEYAILR
jgi:hypothetical protein